MKEIISLTRSWYLALRNTGIDRMETVVLAIKNDSNKSVRQKISELNVKFGWKKVLKSWDGRDLNFFLGFGMGIGAVFQHAGNVSLL